MSSSFGKSDGIVWDAKGSPLSSRFDDKYFCQDNGYEEAVYVCCKGNRLEERFLNLPHDQRGRFTIIETGFGTGLDFCCAWQLWDKCAPASWELRFISLERYPLSAESIRRALGLWKDLGDYCKKLLAQYQPVPGSILDVSLPEDRVHLTIVFDDVVIALERMLSEGLAGQGADAWFLDGFAPKKNPEMWDPAVFRSMPSLSRPGATCSTFTVAGCVRRGLEENGFKIEKIAGHGRKRHVLTGVLLPESS